MSGRPAVVTPFRYFYLRNHWTDSLAVFFCVGWLHPKITLLLVSSLLPSIGLFLMCEGDPAKIKRCQFSNNCDNPVITIYSAVCAETSHACRHPPGNVFPCVTVVWSYILHVRTYRYIARSLTDLEKG